MFGFLGAIAAAAGSLIGGAVSTVGHFVAGGIAKVAGTVLGKVGTVAGKVVSGVKGLFGGLKKVLGPKVGKIVTEKNIEHIADVASTVAEVSKATQKKQDPDELGYRLYMDNEAENPIVRENYNTSDEYTAKLEERYPTIDKTKDWNEHVGGYKIIGSSYLYLETAKKLGIEIPAEFMIDIGRCRMGVDEVMSIINAFRSLKLEKVTFAEYLLGNLNSIEENQILNAVITAMQEAKPGLTREDAAVRIGQMRAAAKSDEEVAQLYKDEIEKQKGKEAAAGESLN